MTVRYEVIVIQLAVSTWALPFFRVRGLEKSSFPPSFNPIRLVIRRKIAVIHSSCDVIRGPGGARDPQARLSRGICTLTQVVLATLLQTPEFGLKTHTGSDPLGQRWVLSDRKYHKKLGFVSSIPKNPTSTLLAQRRAGKQPICEKTGSFPGQRSSHPHQNFLRSIGQ